MGLKDIFGPTYQAQVTGDSATVDGVKGINAAMMVLGAIMKNPQMSQAAASNIIQSDTADKALEQSSWSNMFNNNVAPYYGMGGSSGADFGRQGFLTDGAGQLDWLNSGGFTF
jgi:hypothetical protein